MKTYLARIGLLAAVMLAGILPARALDGAIVIANSSLASDSLSADALKDVYTGKTKYWDGGQNIVIVVLSDKTDAAVQQASGMEASQFKTFWQRLAFSGRGQEPKHADDAAAVVALVAATKGAIAIVPSDTAVAGVKKIEVK
jgi:ABC-type phosphate transport system substrate-binding protein